jgi:hypothetical protein
LGTFGSIFYWGFCYLPVYGLDAITKLRNEKKSGIESHNFEVEGLFFS